MDSPGSGCQSRGSSPGVAVRGPVGLAPGVGSGPDVSSGPEALLPEVLVGVVVSPVGALLASTDRYFSRSWRRAAAAIMSIAAIRRSFLMGGLVRPGGWAGSLQR